MVRLLVIPSISSNKNMYFSETHKQNIQGLSWYKQWHSKYLWTYKLLVKTMKSSKNLSLGNISSFKMVVSLFPRKRKKITFFFQSKTTFFVTTPNSLKWNACTYYYLRDSNSWGWLCKKGRKWLQRLNNSEMQDFDCVATFRFAVYIVLSVLVSKCPP